MSDPLTVRARLDELATELDQRSKELAETERELDPTDEAYEAFVETYECGLWDAHEKDEAKLPGAELRLKLARRAMDKKLLGRYSMLIRKRKRLEKRISSLKTMVSAQQSILSALKSELEASQ